jgi:phosphate transport system substrate-binding protein
VTSGVRALALAKDDKSAPIAGTFQKLMDGKYPLGRYLNLYVAMEPGKSLDPLRREFIRFVFSKEGQEIVVKDGYFPLSASMAAEELKRIESGLAVN